MVAEHEGIMIAPELRETARSRVRWLCSASRETALALCSDARVAYPAEIHCARFGLHILRNVPLPDGYAWEVLQASRYSTGRKAYRAPLEGHVLTLAMYAADLDAADVDLVEFCSSDNRELERAAIFRFARSPRALDNERLLELSFSENDDVRRVVARVLDGRESPYRKEILARLIDDPVRRVSDAACWVAGRSGDPELTDLLVAKDDLFSLSFQGDPRARPRIENLVNSDEPLDGEEAVATAHALGDRELIARLWVNPDWDIRSNAILGSVGEGLLDDAELDDLLARESPDHIAELAFRWPYTKAEGLIKLARLLCEPAGVFPRSDSLAAGRTDALDRVRTWIPTAPTSCGAALRLLPEQAAVSFARELMGSPHAGARTVAAWGVAYRRLTECYPLVAELCVDPDEEVATAAARAVFYGRMQCGLYGLDTAVLRAGADFSAGISARHQLSSLIKVILTDEA